MLASKSTRKDTSPPIGIIHLVLWVSFGENKKQTGLVDSLGALSGLIRGRKTFGFGLFQQIPDLGARPAIADVSDSDLEGTPMQKTSACSY